jgi:hypothetical protein
MTDSGTEALIEALLWSADGRRPALPPAELPESRFVDALAGHRLDGRFLKRIRRDGNPGFSPHLVAQVERRFARTCARVDRQVEMAATLRADLVRHDPTDELVLIKGFTLFGLTGDPFTMRWSGDTDVVCRDLDAFVRVAAAQDFTPEGPRDQLFEYAVLHSGKHPPIELHSYFPVTFVPPGGFTKAKPRDGDSNGWHHEASFGVRRIEYADFRRHVQPGTVERWGVAIVAPELAAVVACAHMLGDYVLNLCPLPVATIRLDELASMLNYTRLPGFSAVRFEELVDALGARDVTRFARVLATALLAVDPFPWRKGRPTERSSFPRDLWWDGQEGFMVDVGFEPRECVVRTSSMGAVLDRLAVSTVPVTPGAPAVVCAQSDKAADVPVVWRSDKGRSLPVRVELSWHGDGLGLDVGVPRPPLDEMIGLSLNFGDYRYEFFYRTAESSLQADDYSNLPAPPLVRTAVATADAHHVVSIRISWPGVGADPDHPTDTPLLLGVRTQRREWGHTTSEVLVPLVIQPRR